MEADFESHSADLAPLSSMEDLPDDANNHLLRKSICSFLDELEFTQTVLVLKATGLGSFRWMVQERNTSGAWETVGRQDVYAAPPNIYRYTCYPHQQIAYTCLSA